MNLDDAGLWDSQMANKEISKLEKSEAKCVASLTIAKLFDIIPPENVNGQLLLSIHRNVIVRNGKSRHFSLVAR